MKYTFQTKPRKPMKRSGFKNKFFSPSGEIILNVKNTPIIFGKVRKSIKKWMANPYPSDSVEARVVFYSHADTNFISPKKQTSFKKKGKMVCAISPALKKKMASDPFYKQCCVTGRKDEKIDWHHNLTFKGKRVNEEFCILPLLASVHREIIRYKEVCDWIMWNRAMPEQIKQYSVAVDYQFEKERLDKKFGNYSKFKFDHQHLT